MQMLCVRYARQVLTCHFPNGCTLAGYGSACVDQSAYHTPSTSSLPASSTGGIHIAATWPPSAATSPAGLGPAPGFLLHTDSAPGHHAPVSPTDGPRARWHSRSSPSPSSAVDAPPCFGTSSRFVPLHFHTTPFYSLVLLPFSRTSGPTPSPPCLFSCQSCPPLCPPSSQREPTPSASPTPTCHLTARWARTGHRQCGLWDHTCTLEGSGEGPLPSGTRLGARQVSASRSPSHHRPIRSRQVSSPDPPLLLLGPWKQLCW